MVKREDILTMPYLKKTEYTGCCEGMRYRLEGVTDADNNKHLRCTIWPEPFNFFTTPEEEKQKAEFTFDEDGIVDAIRWMNDRLFEDKERYDNAARNWDSYH